MTISKKKVMIAAIVGFLCIAIVGSWYLYRRSQNFTTIPGSPNPSFEEVVWMGKGTATEEDTCLITENKEEDEYYYLYFNIIPGKAIIFTEIKGTKETLRGDYPNTREKYHWASIITSIYDITSRNLIQSIDVKKLIEEQAPGYQYDGGWENPFTGKNGHIYLAWYLIDIPKNGDQEYELKYLCMDYETGETQLIDAFAILYDGTEQQENFRAEYHVDSWKVFMEKNRFYGFREGNEERAFDCTYYGTESNALNGVALINIATTALPKENEALYARFPGLKTYQGQEGKVAKICLGGYPTEEETQRLFVEEAIE